MSTTIDRQVNDAFRVLHKRVRLFARRHAPRADDADDMASEACEKAYRHFCALTSGVELTPDNLGQYMDRVYKRAGVALHGARIDQFRKRETERRFFETASPELIAGSWLGGAWHVPAPDQQLIVAETMTEVLRHSTSPGHRRLGEALQRRVALGELDLSPADLAEEANETANHRHGWARKLKSRNMG